jgi:hypothetical protein
MIAQTGERGFHFVDEAAPPALMRELAVELLRRKVSITWWANIRFEKAFTPDLCRLLAQAGCVAISGGLEVASDRLLTLIQKGVTVAQVARVAHAFTQTGIMVHAYLMYGFPTQTDQETIDSLEIVRQLFLNNIIQSAFWHRFSMTAHSPVGKDPALFGVRRLGPEFGGFAENDLLHEDPNGANHGRYSDGLRISLYNYMNGLGLERKLSSWFPFRIKKTKIAAGHIEQILHQEQAISYAGHAKCCWLGGMPTTANISGLRTTEVEFASRLEDWTMVFDEVVYDWFMDLLPSLLIEEGHELISFRELQFSFESRTSIPFVDYAKTENWVLLRSKGLLIL